MKATVLFYLLFAVSCISNNKHSNSGNNLKGTQWRFIGIRIRDSVYYCPKEIKYSINFQENRKIVGNALNPFRGTYKIPRPNYVVIKTISISKGINTDLANANDEMRWRRLYTAGIIGEKHYLLSKDLLEISGKGFTTLFESYKQKK